MISTGNGHVQTHRELLLNPSPCLLPLVLDLFPPFITLDPETDGTAVPSAVCRRQPLSSGAAVKVMHGVRGKLCLVLTVFTEVVRMEKAAKEMKSACLCLRSKKSRPFALELQFLRVTELPNAADKQLFIQFYY